MARDVAFLKEFKVFNDKASAINSNGVCSKLTNMIKRSLWPGQRLAVGKCEYKNIIEARLGIHCLFNEAVLEVMWGLKYLIKFLVPAEEVELTDEDRFQMCKILKLVLNRYGFEVEPKTVNSDIIYAASVVYECDRSVDIRASYLDHGRAKLSEVSQIYSTNWDELKLATALKLICYPEEQVETGDSEEMLSESEAEQLLADAHLNEIKLHKPAYLKIYNDFVWICGVRRKALLQLDSMVKKPREEFKLHQASLDSFMVREAEKESKLHQGCMGMVNGAREEFQQREVSLDSSMDKAKEESKLQQGSPMQMD
ncbi:hypothetical protein BDA96_06G292300 [Sorghum bicolor]|uniref:Uncharacterized protein n=1 Tax=Sorghum bicolor TaxID=4558 RepID=A0A921UE40_SORBI|nr:uncharacterized protein LOC8076471 [Sorghum bicolor]KAG0528133.1 hypothetical protein BDA96_06G292300 [Sorghum bicolor]|eukprot:XP_002447331.2 uncharacterized protein LOC8076471 [Sorghum bicolor]